jgi:hypothetical protein
MYFGDGGTNWIVLAEVSEQWTVLVNALMNLHVP